VFKSKTISTSSINKISILLFIIIQFQCTDKLKSFDELYAKHLQGKFEEVVSDCKKIISTDSLNHEALFLKGRAETALRNYQVAEKNLRRAIELYGKEPEYYSSLAYLMCTTGEYETCKEYSTKAINIDYDNLSGRTNKSWADLELGNYDEALKESQKALILSSGIDDELQKSPIHTNRAIIYDQLNKFEDAEKEAELALKYNPQSIEALMIFAKISFKNRKLKKSLRLIDKAIDLNEEYSLLYIYRGLILIEMNKREKGCNELEKAKKINKIYPHPKATNINELRNKYCKGNKS